MPQPLMAHRTDAAFGLRGIRNSAKCSGDHVTMFKGASEPWTLRRIVTKPVQQLGKTPFRGINSAAPANGFEIFTVSLFGNFCRFGFCPMFTQHIAFTE